MGTATVGRVPLFSLPSIRHSRKGLCASLKIELFDKLLAWRNKSLHGGGARLVNEQHKRLR